MRGLERNGLVQRSVGEGYPAPIEYALTSLGQTLSRPLETLAEWSMRYLPDVQAAQQRYDDASEPRPEG